MDVLPEYRAINKRLAAHFGKGTESDDLMWGSMSFRLDERHLITSQYDRREGYLGLFFKLDDPNLYVLIPIIEGLRNIGIQVAEPRGSTYTQDCLALLEKYADQILARSASLFESQRCPICGKVVDILGLRLCEPVNETSERDPYAGRTLHYSCIESLPTTARLQIEQMPIETNAKEARCGICSGRIDPWSESEANLKDETKRKRSLFLDLEQVVVPYQARFRGGFLAGLHQYFHRTCLHEDGLVGTLSGNCERLRKFGFAEAEIDEFRRRIEAPFDKTSLETLLAAGVPPVGGTYRKPHERCRKRY